MRGRDNARTGGEILIDQLSIQGVRHAFCVPGESYLAALDAFYGSEIKLTVCRHESAAAIMAETYADLYAAAGIHSGLACGAASDLPSAFAAMRQGGGSTVAVARSPLPTIVFHGDRDTTVHPNNGDRIVERCPDAASPRARVIHGRVPEGRAYTRTIQTDGRGRAVSEHWSIHGAGHAWSGGSPAGSYTDPQGPDATREMLRFFLEHSLGG